MTDELHNFKSNCAKLSEDVEKYISLPSITNIQLKETDNATKEQNLKTKELEEQNLKRDEPVEENLEKNKLKIGGNTDQVQVEEISQLNSSLKDEIKSVRKLLI